MEGITLGMVTLKRLCQPFAPSILAASLKELSIEEDVAKKCGYHISKAKNLGLNPEEYLKDLTDSEVMKYDNATLMKIENTDDIKQTTLANDRETICTIEHFYFFYPDGEMRVLLRGEFPENSKAKYRKGLYRRRY